MNAPDDLAAAEKHIFDLEGTIDQMRAAVGAPLLPDEERWCRPSCVYDYNERRWLCGEECGCPARHSPDAHSCPPDEEPAAAPPARRHLEPVPPINPDECQACEGLGWLAGDASVTTAPYEDDELVSRCPTCERFADDLAAAQAIQTAARVPMMIWAIGDGLDLAEGSQPWISKVRRPLPPTIRPRYVEGIYWIDLNAAQAEGLYHPNTKG